MTADTERDELVSRLKTIGRFPTVSHAADQIRRDGERIAELEAENERLRTLIREACDLLSVEVDALKEGISIGGELAPGPNDAHTVAAIDEMEGWIDRAGRAALAKAGRA